MSTDTDALADELRRLADLDARSGEPLGKCMRRAADMIERLFAALQAIADSHGARCRSPGTGGGVMGKPDIVEIMAVGVNGIDWWALLPEISQFRAQVREDMRSALDALDAAGYVVVPREPTRAMMDAAGRVPHRRSDDGDGPDSEEVYLAMIAAATTPEEQP